MTPDLLHQRAAALRRFVTMNYPDHGNANAQTLNTDADYMDQAAAALDHVYRLVEKLVPPMPPLAASTETLPALLAGRMTTNAHIHVSTRPRDKLLHCWLSEFEEALADIGPGYLFERTKHGDVRHQGWLKAAFQCVFRGQPVPEPVHTCHVCGGPTQMACSDCRINFGASVHICSKPECRKRHDELCAGDTAKETARKHAIQLTPAEIQSGLDRVRFAELLIKQLPTDHDGRNTWLLNYGAKP